MMASDEGGKQKYRRKEGGRTSLLQEVYLEKSDNTRKIRKQKVVK